MTISIILPTYNEAENIVELINQIDKNLNNPEIIVVDDNSPDKTWEIVEKLKKKNVKLIRRINERGLPSAISRGIKESRGDVVVWMDCDFSMPPSFIPNLVNSLDVYDIAIASRYVKGGKDNRSFIRVFTSKIFNVFTQTILNLKVKDTDSGFMAVRKSIFDKITFYEKGYLEYLIKLVFDAKKNNLKIIEIPYVNKDRERGESKSGESIAELLRLGCKSGMAVLKIRFNLLR